MKKGVRFLIIRLSSIGDVLHATPVARALKEAMPSCHITWLVGEIAAEMLAYNPFIDDVHVWPRERWEKALRAGRLREAWSLWNTLKKDLRERSFDIVLDVHGLFLTGMIAAVTGVLRRIGMSGAREMNHLFMTETAPGPAQSRHSIHRYLSVLRPLGIDAYNSRMDLFLSPQALSFADTFLRSNRVRANKPLIVINPATTWTAKNWPAEYFAAVINSLQGRADLLLCGGPGDRQLADRIIRHSQTPIIDAVGKTSLLETAALVLRSTVLLTGDTGPLHMAVALDVPTVSIFGPTDPAVYGPLAGSHVVLRGDTACAPCNKRQCPKRYNECMYAVLPDQAVWEIKKLL